jgi:hypothetical protein
MRTVLCILLLGAMALVAAPDTNITGKWSGSFVITRDGETKDTTAVLVLKQNGSEVTGTVGPNEEEQHAITKGTIEGDKITLTADHEGMVIKFDLVLAADRITGDVNMARDAETAKAKIDVTRAK